MNWKHAVTRVLSSFRPIWGLKVVENSAEGSKATYYDMLSKNEENDWVKIAIAAR